jgi:hypothetical protein
VREILPNLLKLGNFESFGILEGDDWATVDGD